MVFAIRRCAAGVILALSFVADSSCAESQAFLGRPVVEVLRELRSGDLDFIYSSELVPATMRVLAEPRETSPLLVAREVLAAHGLALSVVRPGLYAVIVRPATDATGPDAETPDAAPRLPTELAAVVVSTSRYAFDRSGSVDAVQIAGETLAAQPVIGEDAIRALGRLPGIAQNGLSAQSGIRGGETSEVLTLLDGFPLRQAFHMPGYQSPFGVLDPGLLEDAEVFTGGFPVRYGNRMGGVFDLRTIEATSEPATALGLSVFNAMARRGGSSDALGVDWLAAGRVGTLKPFIDAFAHDAGSPTYADAYARAGMGDPDRLRVTANVLWSHDELSIEREGFGEQAQIDSRNYYVWLRADRDWRNGVQGSLWLGYSDVDSDRNGTLDDPDTGTGSVDDHRSSDYREARARLAWQPRRNHWLEGGFEWTDEEARYRYSAAAQYTDAAAALFSRDPTLTRASTLDPSRERVALFASHRWRFARDWVSELGLRTQRTITHGSTTENWLYDPRVNLRWQVAPRTSLRAHWGRFHQTDEVHELKVEDGQTSFPEAQKSDHLIAGLDHRLNNELALRIEAFRKRQSQPRPRFENLLDPLSLTPEIAVDRIMVAPISAEARGLEFSLIGDHGGGSWWTSLVWSEARDAIDGAHVPRSWDQTWAAIAGIDWTRGRWRYGAIASAHSSWPTTRVYETSLGPRNRADFPTRAALDLRAEYRRPLTTGRMALTFELANAVNVGNTCCAELVANDDGAGGVSFTTRRSDWLPLVPSVGVLWEF